MLVNSILFVIPVDGVNWMANDQRFKFSKEYLKKKKH